MTLCLKDKLEELERKLEDAFHAAGDDVPEIREGQVCVAYVDGLFHRVRAIKKETRNGDQIFKVTLILHCLSNPLLILSYWYWYEILSDLLTDSSGYIVWEGWNLFFTAGGGFQSTEFFKVVFYLSQTMILPE